MPEYIRTIKRKVKRFLDCGTGKKAVSLSDIGDDIKVVSFDIFDTLIVRDTDIPSGVFAIMEKELGIPGFSGKRVAAERNARMNKHGTTEVTIDEIYRAFEGITPEQAEEYAAAEFDTELRVCHRDPGMAELFAQCAGKYRVVIISDMYLPEKMMRELLEHCGITGYEKMYVSCDHGCSKYVNGELFGHAAEDLGVSPGDILHIGNDYVSDHLRARKAGVRTLKIRTARKSV